MGLIKLPQRSKEFFESNYQEIFEQGSLAEGRWNTESSNLVKKYTGISHAIPVSSNGTGMAATLQLMNHLYERDSVLIQSNTMYGVLTMVNASGSSVEGIIDCDTLYLGPNLEMVKTAVEKLEEVSLNKLIILLSHIGGTINPWIEEISNFCKERNILLLEDCAHSYGATLNGKHSGSFGDAGVYSFYSTKAIMSGEGGMIVTNNEELGNLSSKYTMYDRFDRKLPIANNIRQSEIQALLLTAVLNEAEEIVANKRLIANKYIDCCTNLGLEFISQNGANNGNYYKFILSTKDELIKEKYRSLTKVTSKVYDYALGNSEEVINSHVCLPIWYAQEEDITQETLDELITVFQ